MGKEKYNYNRLKCIRGLLGANIVNSIKSYLSRVNQLKLKNPINKNETDLHKDFFIRSF